MQSAFQEFIKEQETSAAELNDLMFIDKQFDTLTVDDMKVLSECENLEFLNFAEVGLKSIEAPFPVLPSVSALILSNNHLSNDCISLLVGFENLESLALDGNQITSLEKFATLAGLSKLREISLADCPVTESKDYRSKLFSLLPQLQIVDEEDKDGNVIEDAGSDGDISDSDDEFGSELGSDDVIEDEAGNKINLKDFYASHLGSEDEEEDEDEEEEDEDDDDDDDDEEDDEEDEDEGEADGADASAAKKARN